MSTLRTLKTCCKIEIKFLIILKVGHRESWLPKESSIGSIPWDKMEGPVIRTLTGQASKKLFSALWASVRSKNKGSPGPRASPLDLPLASVNSVIYFTYSSSQSEVFEDVPYPNCRGVFGLHTPPPENFYKILAINPLRPKSDQITFLLTSKYNKEKRLRELIKWSSKGKYLDVFFFQIPSVVWGYWCLKGKDLPSPQIYQWPSSGGVNIFLEPQLFFTRYFELPKF